MEFYHVINRGVDKRTTFQEEGDYLRFIQNLHIYNSTESAPHNVWSTSARMKIMPVKKLVTIHAYCLMPNHYHLLLSPLVDDGITKFMHKVGMGYSKYFNEKNERTGVLWQGKYKSINITTDAQLNYIPYYINLNALDLSHPQWRRGAVTNTQNALTRLQQYKWSSHSLFLYPEKIDTSILSGSFFTKELSQAKYIQEIVNIISDKTLAQYSESIELK
ncbi:MAG: putative transposase [Acidimicrobiales bacterium]|jgi:putative transposase